MKSLSFLFIFLGIISGTAQTSEISEKKKINQLLNEWHEAAAEADYKDYFEAMAEESVFIGTDPTENWSKPEFMVWSKPHFEAGKAWSFSTLERNIFLADDCAFAWFDELLETQMGVCRGSGVVSKEDGEWKIKHYVLSIEIPNEQVERVTRLKKDFDTNFITKIKSE